MVPYNHFMLDTKFFKTMQQEFPEVLNQVKVSELPLIGDETMLIEFEVGNNFKQIEKPKLGLKHRALDKHWTVYFKANGSQFLHLIDFVLFMWGKKTI